MDSKKDAMDKEDALGPGILGRREGGLGMTCLLVMRLLFFSFFANEPESPQIQVLYLGALDRKH